MDAPTRPQGLQTATGTPLKLRLPVLRRPPGWTVLGEPALRVRATQLFHACEPPAHGTGIGRSDAALQDTAAKGGTHERPREAEPGASRLSPDPGPAEGPAALPTRAPEPPRASHATLPPVAAASARTPAPARAFGVPWRVLPWALLPTALMALGPWRVWAPLVAGLSLGILLLGTGALGQWLARLRLDDAPAPEASRSNAALPALETAAGEPCAVALQTDPVAAVNGVQPAGPPRLRVVHPGWLLTAALALVGVQAAMLIATVQTHRQATAPRASQPETAAEAAGARAAAGAEQALKNAAADQPVGPQPASPRAGQAPAPPGRQEAGR